MILSTSDFLLEKVRFRLRTFDVEGVPVEMLGLTDKLIEDVQLCTTSETMYLAAADFGISSGGVRVYDDELLSEYIDQLWEHKDYNMDCDPSFKIKVGEKVCAISGLTEFVEAQWDSENAVDGDNLGDTSVTLEELNQHKAVA